METRESRMMSECRRAHESAQVELYRGRSFSSSLSSYMRLMSMDASVRGDADSVHHAFQGEPSTVMEDLGLA